MESSKSDRIGRRRELEAFERASTGGYHIGHLPIYVQEIEGWTFRRCRCGFTLALTGTSAILWLKMTKPATEINNFRSLLRALNSNCWVHPRPEPPKDAITPVQAIAETTEALASKSAVSSPPRQESSNTQHESKPPSKELAAGMPGVEKKLPPVKQRRTYVPETTTRRTRERQKPFGR
jgi:hypothetical protein